MTRIGTEGRRPLGAIALTRIFPRSGNHDQLLTKNTSPTTHANDSYDSWSPLPILAAVTSPSLRNPTEAVLKNPGTQFRGSGNLCHSW